MIKYKVENGKVLFGEDGEAVLNGVKYYSLSSDLCVSFWPNLESIPACDAFSRVPTLREVCIKWLRNRGTNPFGPSGLPRPAMPFGMEYLNSLEIALPDGETTLTFEDVYGYAPQPPHNPYEHDETTTDSDIGVDVKHVNPTNATSILSTAAATISDRASERDTEAERSMRKTVTAFNAMFGHNLTETQGWQFMELLKMARSTGGSFRLDDYLDGAAYAALAGECASGNV